MKFIKQIIYDLKTQPVIGAVSIIGTAMAIMLIMVVMMIRQIQVAPVAPESNRDRLLYEYGMCIQNDDNMGSSRLSMAAVDKLYGGLKTPEVISVMQSGCDQAAVSADGGEMMLADMRMTDENMWKIFDHKFLSGKPYSEADVLNGNRVVVITESLARKLLGTPDAVGRTITINQYPFKVVGVVRDVSPLMGWSYAQLWKPIKVSEGLSMSIGNGAADKYFGPFSVVSMAKTPEDVDEMRREIRSRNASFNNELKADGWSRADTGFPYVQEQVHALKGTNKEPDVSTERMVHYILIAIILLVPAINLSSMTQSRLRQRRHEIGVRRAFGAKRSSILRAILVENLFVTLVGGLIGLILTFVMSYMFTSLFYEPAFSWTGYSVEMSLNASMLFSWSIFGWALLFCFVLNLLSAGIPAWRAAHVDPVEAINGITK